MFEILTPMQMRAAEEASVRLGTGLDVLMDNAGGKACKKNTFSISEDNEKKIS